MDSWSTWLAGPGWSALAPWLVNELLPKQRWFGGKGQGISSVSVQDAGWLAGEGGQVLLLIARVRSESGQEDDYFVPLWLSTVSQVENSIEAAGPDGPTYVSDAGVIDEACRFLVRLVERNETVRCSRGTIVGFPCDPDVTGTDLLPLRRSQAEQSNTSFFLGEQFVCKLLRRLPEGINPDYEITRYLTEVAKFPHVPALHGAIEYQRKGEEPRTLAMVQQFVPSKYDGWEQATRVLREYSLQKPGAPPGLGKYGQCVELLGQRTAELHLALASGPAGSFAPEALIPEGLERPLARIQTDAPAWLEALITLTDSSNDAERARSILNSRLCFLSDALQGQPGFLGQRIRCHGDYHLGQVLWDDTDYFILDFEGEPTRPLAERRARHSPLKDVAGMVRSFAYAEGYLKKVISVELRAKAAVPAMRWRRMATTAFLGAYRFAMKDSDLVPRDDKVFAGLLSLYVLDKAFYEIDYERRHRPDWEDIPNSGIAEELASLDKLGSAPTA